MRRIGIAIELVCDQPIMLLDEPTSALDAVNTRLVVTALKDLCKRGILVIASLHQPRESVFSAHSGFCCCDARRFMAAASPLAMNFMCASSAASTASVAWLELDDDDPREQRGEKGDGLPGARTDVPGRDAGRGMGLGRAAVQNW